ncbi:hypothetical protein KKG05_01865 [bacterium]|nr:hypothetical protein [bacterium]MBU1936119.1 hypothetical protein [bacterium]
MRNLLVIFGISIALVLMLSTSGVAEEANPFKAASGTTLPSAKTQHSKTTETILSENAPKNQSNANHLDGYLTCDNWIPINCGATVNGNTTGGQSSVEFYIGCTDWYEAGPEVVYLLTLTEESYVSVSISQSCDLDVFMMCVCDENSCIAYGDYDFTTDCLEPRDYFIVVDGYAGDACAYQLHVTCTPCSPAPFGDNCSTPITLWFPYDLPYVDEGETTCGRGDDYSNTCLGDFDEAQDFIIRMAVLNSMTVDFEVNASVDSIGIALDNSCPPDGNCLASATGFNGKVGLYNVSLTPGYRYLIIDSWAQPGCIAEFDLEIHEPNPCAECPSGGIAEGEPTCYDDYEDTENVGCDAVGTPQFTSINFDDVICGTSGTFSYYGSDYRDTDWYEIVLPEGGEITWTVTAEFPIIAEIINPGSGDCSDYETLASEAGDACDALIVTSDCLPGGTYWLRAAPALFSGIPCGMHYLAEATYEVCSVIIVPQHMVIEIIGNDVRLAWDPDANPYYDIYSGANPMGVFTTFEGTTSDTTWTKTNGAHGSSKRYYQVVGSDTP